jgi:signal peptidase I
LLGGPELLAVAEIWKRQKRELTASFGGSSMEPTIHAGQPLTLRCGDDYAAGDVIAFVIEDQLGVHRVMAKFDGWIVTRGDAKILPDPPLTDLSRVVARIVDVPPAKETFARWIAKVLLLTGCRGNAGVVTRRMTWIKRVAGVITKA